MPADTALIRLGRISGTTQLELAARAIRKAMRCSGMPLSALLVQVADRGSIHVPQDSGIRPIAPEAIEIIIERHLSASRMFVPTADEASSDLVLYALASGVPLGAISLHRLPGNAALHDNAPAPMHGEIYLLTPAYRP